MFVFRGSCRERWRDGKPSADNCLRVNPAWRWMMRGADREKELRREGKVERWIDQSGDGREEVIEERMKERIEVKGKS